MPRIPDILTAKNLLVVQPHYDDADIGAAGTLARLHAAGARITYVTVTDDLVGVSDPTLSDEEARKRLVAEQWEAGAIVGVEDQVALGYPDAGRYDYFDVRRDIIREIRRVRPDFVLVCDPWLSYEAHRDHIQCGLVVAEAVTLYGLMRLKADPAVDAAYTPHEVKAVVFYFTSAPNTFVGIDEQREIKHRAIACYRTQLSDKAVERINNALDARAKRYAKDRDCDYAEAFKVLRPGMLHVNVDAATM